MLQDMHGVDPRQNAVIDSLETAHQKPVATVGAGMGTRDQAIRMAHRDRARMRSMEDPRYSVWRGNPEVEAEDNRARMHEESLRMPMVSNAVGSGKMSRGDLSMFKKLHTPKGKSALRKAIESMSAYVRKGKFHIGDKAVSDEALSDHVARGGSFFGDLWSGVKSVGNFVKPFAEPIGNLVGSRFGMPSAGTIAKGALDMLGSGRRVVDYSGRELHRGHEMATHPLYTRNARAIGRGKDSDSDSDGSSDSDEEMKGGYARTASQRHVQSPTGGGFLSSLGIPIISDLAGAIGLGKGKRKASGADGRSARNAIVRKVMAEKGLKMIEASKYVKAHGLY
jgi:hypothetical protein